MRHSAVRSVAWLAIPYLASVVSAQNYNFVGALQIVNGVPNAAGYSQGGYNPGSNAVPAQCPSDHPVSCTNLNQPNYCCPSSKVCSYANGVVACCPQGETCSGFAGGGYVQTTQWQPPPTTVYWQPSPTTVYVAGGNVAPPAQPTTIYDQPDHGQQYCTTLYAHGPGLPATQSGQCGMMLILNDGGRIAAGWKIFLWAVVMQVIGMIVLARGR